MEKKNNEIMFFHGTTVDGCRYTMSGKFIEDDLHIGIAICSESEPFSKSKGRKISTGRLLKDRGNHIGRLFLSVYAGQLGEQYRSECGYPEGYFEGREITVFRDFVKNYNRFTKKELQHEFSLFKTSS